MTSIRMVRGKSNAWMDEETSKKLQDITATMQAPSSEANTDGWQGNARHHRKQNQARGWNGEVRIAGHRNNTSIIKRPSVGKYAYFMYMLYCISYIVYCIVQLNKQIKQI